MSLRRSIFVVLAAAVLITVGLEVVLDVVIDGLVGEASEGLAANRLLLDLLDVPVMVLVAIVLGWLLARHLAQPLRRLTAATRSLATDGSPAPVEVPAGDDELSELARSFNTMSLALAGFVERERAFTRYASHELRTPLSAMRLQLERAELGLVPAEETLPVLRRNVAQLEEILGALLSLARSPHGESEHRLLAPLLHDSLANFPAAERTRLIVRDGAPASLRVTHARLLQQSMTNLIENALRHGSGRATVEVEAVGGSLTLRIQDEGPGVQEPDLDRITEPFFRGSEDHGGSGLGLSFVAFVAKALGGELRLDSSTGGLLAVLTLPIVAPA